MGNVLKFQHFANKMVVIGAESHKMFVFKSSLICVSADCL